MARGFFLAALAFIAVSVIGGGTCQARLFDPGMLDPAGPVGMGERTILLDSLAIMLCIVVPVILMTIAFSWWFRASNQKAKHLPDWEYSGRLEIVVWSIPAMVVLFLGGIAWVSSHELDPHQALNSTKKPIEIQVVSMDWKWLFIYPEQGVASVNQVMMPVGVPVDFVMTSAGVMNSFFIPRLGSQIYTMAGMTTSLNLEASEPGTFPGISAQFSGDGFSDMHFNAIAVPQADFDKWVATAKSSQATLTQATYDKLLVPSEADPVTTYSGVPDGLFKQIVAESAPGTQTGAMNEHVEEPASSPSSSRTKD